MGRMPHLAELRIHPVKSFRPIVARSAVVEPWGLAGDRRWMLAQADGSGLTQRQLPLLGQFSAVPRPDGGLLVRGPGDAGSRLVAPPRPDAADGTAVVQVFAGHETFPTAVADKETNDWLSELVGQDVRLVFQHDPAERDRPYVTSLADGYPMLLATTESLDALNALIAADHPDDPVKGAPVPMGRFRPNLVVSGAKPWAETGWKRIRVGAVEFAVVKACGRCVMTTLDPETSERRGPEPLRALARHRRFGKSLDFAMNLAPVNPDGTPYAPTGAELNVGDEVVVLEAGPPPLPDQRA